MSEDDDPASRAESYADDLDDSLDPSSQEDAPSFDVTSGEDLVETLPSGSEVPAEVRRAFWTSAILLKVAILALSGAALLAYFRGELVLAAGLVAVGLLAATRTALKVRSFRQSE